MHSYQRSFVGAHRWEPIYQCSVKYGPQRQCVLVNVQDTVFSTSSFLLLIQVGALILPMLRITHPKLANPKPSFKARISKRNCLCRFSDSHGRREDKMLLFAQHVYKMSNISEAAKFAYGIFQSGACRIQLITHLCLLMSIFSYPRNKEQQKRIQGSCLQNSGRHRGNTMCKQFQK